MNQPYISIIIPLYNKCKTIKDTVKSVLKQNYENFEVIVVDDGSTDSSADAIKEINDIRVNLFQQKNSGPSSARNKGVELSEGEWILFLDADDTLLPLALMTVLKSMNHEVVHVQLLHKFNLPFWKKPLVYTKRLICKIKQPEIFFRTIFEGYI